MQYIREYANGNRKAVSEWEWLADRQSVTYRSLHQYGAVVIYTA